MRRRSAGCRLRRSCRATVRRDSFSEPQSSWLQRDTGAEHEPQGQNYRRHRWKPRPWLRIGRGPSGPGCQSHGRRARRRCAQVRQRPARRRHNRRRHRGRDRRPPHHCRSPPGHSCAQRRRQAADGAVGSNELGGFHRNLGHRRQGRALLAAGGTQRAAQAGKPRRGRVEWCGRERIADVGRLRGRQAHALDHGQIRQRRLRGEGPRHSLPGDRAAADHWRDRGRRRGRQRLCARHGHEARTIPGSLRCAAAASAVRRESRFAPRRPEICRRCRLRSQGRYWDHGARRGSGSLSPSLPPSAPPTPRQAQFLALAEKLRPELHRYCARLMGSVIDGEDVVQDTFARAFVALDKPEESAPMRAWLFRIAHNRALDLLRSRATRQAEPIEAAQEVADTEIPDPVEMMMRREAVETAVSRFAELPTMQRSVVILKDVLDQSLEEIAALLDLTVNAVKAHLARGRARLKTINAQTPAKSAPRQPSPAVARYVDLFNRRDWERLRSMLADDVRLIQSTYPPRAGAADVGTFFGIYSRSAPVRLVPAWLDGREVIAVYEDAAAKPSYMMWLEWTDGRISFIRDYKYVRYVIDDAELILAPDTAPSGEATTGG